MSRNKYHLITVATHNEGTLEDIITNDFNIKVKVLGFGRKWTGFNMKHECVLEYINDVSNNVRDEDIIIFIDGFDSLIKKNPQEAIDRYNKIVEKDNNIKIVMSEESNLLPRYISKNVFGECKNTIANSGLYMGNAGFLREILTEISCNSCKDDQVRFNKICMDDRYRDNFYIDKNNEIFQNILLNTEFYNNESVFVSYPGGRPTQRFSRSFKEYSQFFIKYIVLLFLIILPCFYFITQNTKINILLSFVFCVGFYIYYFHYIDKSCIN